MKKFISVALLSAVLASTSLSAKTQDNTLENNIATNRVNTIDQKDANFLFQDVEVNKVAVLNDEEMKNTKGQFWQIFIAIILGTAAAGKL